MRKVFRGLGLLCATVLALTLVVSFSGITFAHAAVIASNPRMGSTITKAPDKVVVTTAENMNPDPKLSNLTIYGPKGEVISDGNSVVTKDNPKEMSIGLKPSGDGVYIVRWATVSADDNDADEGVFTFTVNAKGSTTTTTPATTNTNTGTTASNTASGVAVWVPIVSSLATLLLGLGLGVAFGRRGSSASSLSTIRNARSQQTDEETTHHM